MIGRSPRRGHWLVRAASNLGLLSGNVVLLLGVTATGAVAQGPVGDPFQINQNTSGGAYFPDVVGQPDGSFVVVWSSDTDGDGAGVRARRYSRNGTPLTDSFPVNQKTVGDQYRPRIATDGDGGFVVIWSGQDGDGTGVTGRLFAANGSALGADFQVNAQTIGSQRLPAVSRNASGTILVSWFDPPSDSVVAATFDSSGLPLLPQFVVSIADTYPGTADSAGGIRSDGGFVVAWEKIHDVDGHPMSDIFQQRYAADGTPLSGEFQVSDNGPNGWYFSYNPDVGVDESDNFIVVWHTQLFLEWGEVSGRRTDASGATGPIWHLSGASLGVEAFSIAPGGEFVVHWSDYSAYYRERSSRFDTLGNEVESFLLTDGFGISALAHLSADPAEFVSARRAAGTDSDLIGQRFGSRLFADGFESGDTSEWSATIP